MKIIFVFEWIERNEGERDKVTFMFEITAWKMAKFIFCSQKLIITFMNLYFQNNHGAMMMRKVVVSFWQWCAPMKQAPALLGKLGSFTGGGRAEGELDL